MFTPVAEPEFEPGPEPEPEAPSPAARPAWREPDAGHDEPAPLEELPPPDEPSSFEPEQPAFSPQPELPEVGLDEAPPSPEAMIGEAESEVSPLDQLTEPSPFDEALLDAPPVVEQEALPPSWDEIAETCRGLAQAQGAMLIDPAGQVFASRGQWPAPGPEQMAAKLVAKMASTLKDAPTRAISAPLMGQHLTAWRIPTAEGLMTVAFIGPAPVHADARPDIDNVVLTAVGA